jgi:hypothetical protein
MLAKKLWGKFPFFFAYMLSSFLSSAGLYALRGRPITYFYVYWVCEAIGLLLGLAVIYEVFRKLLQPYAALHKLAANVLLLTVALLVASSCFVAYAQPSAERSPLAAGILVGEEATRIIEIGLLMFLFIFSTAFGLHWRQQAFGIAVGLGLFVAVELIGVTARTRLGVAALDVFTVVRMLAFNISLLIWTGYLVVPEKATSTQELPQRAQLEQWNQAIMELINQ